MREEGGREVGRIHDGGGSKLRSLDFTLRVKGRCYRALGRRMTGPEWQFGKMAMLRRGEGIGGEEPGAKQSEQEGAAIWGRAQAWTEREREGGGTRIHPPGEVSQGGQGAR